MKIIFKKNNNIRIESVLGTIENQSILMHRIVKLLITDDGSLDYGDDNPGNVTCKRDYFNEDGERTIEFNYLPEIEFLQYQRENPDF